MKGKRPHKMPKMQHSMVDNLVHMGTSSKPPRPTKRKGKGR